MAIFQPLRPTWLRRDHPVVERYLRRPQSSRFQVLVFGSTLGFFVLLGGLSLPALYALFSLVILLQMSTSTVDKVHDERQSYTWDLVRLTPYSARELLLSLWAASLWQLQRTWMMRIYLLLHGVVIIGVMVHTVAFANPTPNQALLLLVMGTFFIVFQPYIVMYFSGMLSLAVANRVRERGSAQGFAIGLVLLYWLAYVGSSLAFILFVDLRLSGGQFANIVLIPLLIPVCLGWLALHLAESSLS
jgi:hypothetical protein